MRVIQQQLVNVHQIVLIAGLKNIALLVLIDFMSIQQILVARYVLLIVLLALAMVSVLLVVLLLILEHLLEKDVFLLMDISRIIKPLLENVKPIVFTVILLSTAMSVSRIISFIYTPVFQVVPQDL